MLSSSRAELQRKGQFWTPAWVAEAMATYVLHKPNVTILDPAFGIGAFLLAAQKIAAEKQVSFHFSGYEIDEALIETAQYTGLKSADLQQIHLQNFIQSPPTSFFDGILGNPPYIRHHFLDQQLKDQLKAIALRTLGFTLDGRTGLHTFFLILALQSLSPNGRLAFIVPASICEGLSSRRLWSWITQRYSLEAVVTFANDASPFPNIDTNPIIFFIRNSPPQATFAWIKLQKDHSPYFQEWAGNGFFHPQFNTTIRNIEEGLKTGFSRPQIHQTNQLRLGDFIRVMRGIATGANDFFFLTETQLKELSIPIEFTHLAIGRTRDIPAETLTEKTLHNLEQIGRPTRLLYLNRLRKMFLGFAI